MTTYTIPETLFGQHIKDYLAAKKRSWRQATYRQYAYVLSSLCAYVGEKWPIEHTDILAYFDSTKANDTSVRSYFCHIRAAFNYWAELGVIDRNPTELISKLRLLPKADDLPPVGLSQEEIEQFFDLLTRNAQFGGVVAWRDLALFRLGYVTGMRAAELGRLTWEDIDLAQRSALIRISKSRKHRTVYFSKLCAANLTAYRDRLTAWGCEADHVFLSLNDPNQLAPKALTGNGIYQLWKRRLKAAGLEPVKFHALRHTSAQHALSAGVPIHMVQAQLGHSDITTTAKYLRGRDSERSAAYRDFDID